MNRPLRIGISSCLLGEKVRWNGADKLAPWLDDLRAIAPIEWVPTCPEVEIGLGVPREPIELADRNGETALRVVATGEDLTRRMRDFARERARSTFDVDGWVLKSRSPSCGLEGVPVADSPRTGRGLFADGLVRARPGLPVVEESELATDEGRRRFVARAEAYRAHR